MTPIYSAIPRFKRIEAALREALNAQRSVLREIDQAAAGRRTREDAELLNELRDRIQVLAKTCGDLVLWFNDKVA